MSTDRRTSKPEPIYRGTDLARIAELRQAADTAERIYQQAQKSGTGRMGDAESPQAAKDAHDAFVTEAAERAVMVVLKALGRKQWRALLNEHPPRRVTRLVDGAQSEVVHEDDVDLGVNVETFSEALLMFSEGSGDDLVQTIAEPSFSSRDARLKWLDDLSGGDFDKLFMLAFALNGSMGYDPLQSRYSAGSPTSPETSE